MAIDSLRRGEWIFKIGWRGATEGYPTESENRGTRRDSQAAARWFKGFIVYLAVRMMDYYRNAPSGRLPDNATTRLLARHDARAFHAALPGYAPTPLYALPGLASRLGIGALYVKDEAPRFGLNAFKGLGASYAIHELLRSDPAIETFCTATDGNHGRAVAWAARLAEKRAVVYVPEHTQPARIAAIESEGAQVIHLAEDYDTACRIAERTAAEKGWQLVQDVAWAGYERIPALIMAGYLTHFRELEATLGSAEE